MNLIFLTLIDITDINERGIYQDLLRKFRDEGHSVYIVSPSERRKKIATRILVQDNITLLKVKTLNIQKTNLFEKGIGTLLLEHQFLSSYKKYFSKIKFDLVVYSTPPITLTKVVGFIKKKDGATSYLLLKDIFPQNAVDLGMIKKGGLLHKFFSQKEKQLYKVSDYIGCMSPANVEFVKRNHPELSAAKVEVNPNSIQPVKIEMRESIKNELRNKYGIPTNDVVFIYGGNLGKPQGIDFLIEVLTSNVNRKGVFFVIVGAGTEYGVIDEWYRSSRPSNILLLESLPKKDYDELVRACDVGLIFLDRRFTIPNFPSRLLSYLEYRMPVIAATDKNTDIGRILEGAGAGYWTEAGDVERFNRLMSPFIEDRVVLSEMGAKAYRLLEKEYTVDVSYKAIVEKLAKREQVG